MFSLILLGWREKPMNAQPTTLSSLNDIPRSSWDKLATKKIYFGHQSVGFNIIDGIESLMKKNPFIKLTIVETNNPKDFDKPVLAHSRVGQNMNPHSKCDFFSEYILKGLGNKVDIAFFKFCYVDVTKESDPQEIFNYYKNTLTRLQSEYPTTHFVPVTIPLVTIQRWIKAWIKKIIKCPLRGYSDNIIRNQLNELLRNYYRTQHYPIFDLSLFESTHTNGSRAFFKMDNKIYFALASEYSTDRGHLNEQGRRHVAEQLLIHLAQLAEKE